MANPTSSEESEIQQERTWLRFVGGLVLYILFGVGLWWILDWYINPQNSTQKKDLIQALGLIMAGVAGAIGIYFTWRGQRITRESLESTQENTQEQLRLTREGQITERFTRAIDQLGNDSLEIRLGGIYALERIARDSPERDYSTVIEVLTAYVRENAPWPPKPPKAPEGPPESSGSDSDEAGIPDKGVDQAAEQAPQTPPTDIQAILDVLKRLEEERLEEERIRREEERTPKNEESVAEKLRVHLDLRGTDLRGANLVEAHLEGAVLWRAHLEGANLQGATVLTQGQIDRAYGDETTILPEGFVHPEHWIKSTDEPPNGEE